MHPLVRYYKNTWWLWLLFVTLFVFLAIKVSAIFFILIPGLLVYSVYFGMVRVSEETRVASRQMNESQPPTPR